MFKELKHADIKNILIYVCDALRFDFLPEEVAEMGVTFKTIASSIFTASSFASIVSGLYPPKHGVLTWDDLLPEEKRTMSSLDGMDFSLRCETTWTDLPPNDSQIHDILGNPDGEPIEKLNPPFIYLEDDKGGHCPYGRQVGKYLGSGCPDFFKEYGEKGQTDLIKQYKKGIDISVTNFKKRLDTIDDLGLRDSTLVIFTADHGELLGEYGGLTGHGGLACPEVVYVPTVLIHPVLKTVRVKDKVIRHVDFLPTILDILKIDSDYEGDGISLMSCEDYPLVGFNFKFGGFRRKNIALKILNVRLSSVWDYYGGIVFNRYRIGTILKSMIKSINKHPDFSFMFSNLERDKIFKRVLRYFTAIKCLSFKKTYLAPNFKRRTASKAIKTYSGNLKKFETQKISIDEKKLKILKSLGYYD